MSEADHDILITLKSKVDQMALDIIEIKSHYTLKVEFTPVQKIVFTGVALALIAIAGSLLNMAIKPH